MRYLLYLSSDKLDMLFDQLASGRKGKITTEVASDLKIFKAKIGTETELNVSTSRLETVIEAVNTYKKPGDLADLKPWIFDTLDVKHISMVQDPNVFMLIGKRDGRYHCLGGSAHNMIGNRRPIEMNAGHSTSSALLRAIESYFSPEGERYDAYSDFKVGRTMSVDRRVSRDCLWAYRIHRMYEAAPTATIRVGFLARFHQMGRWGDDAECTLSSPLYVELL